MISLPMLGACLTITSPINGCAACNGWDGALRRAKYGKGVIMGSRYLTGGKCHLLEYYYISKGKSSGFGDATARGFF